MICFLKSPLQLEERLMGPGKENIENGYYPYAINSYFKVSSRR